MADHPLLGQSVEAVSDLPHVHVYDEIPLVIKRPAVVAKEGIIVAVYTANGKLEKDAQYLLD